MFLEFLWLASQVLVEFNHLHLDFAQFNDISVGKGDSAIISLNQLVKGIGVLACDWLDLEVV